MELGSLQSLQKVRGTIYLSFSIDNHINEALF